jgi:hypothetical protein
VNAKRRPLPGWTWAALLGLGLIAIGLVASWVAIGPVVLEYDEAFIGLSRRQLLAANPRVLDFMTHDRITLAGSLIAIGFIYVMLALHAIRAGEAWAARVLRVSGLVGFASFFLFVGFRYFDPLHFAVTLLVLPFFLMTLRRGPRDAAPPRRPPPTLGRLAFVGLGLGLVAAGGTIAALGVTGVFVPSDLEFIGASRAQLDALSPNLIPVIAHDRAGLGGTIACLGLALTLTAWWGYRPGAYWLWWTLLGSGAVAVAAAIGVHVATGYVDTFHLLPAYLALAQFVLGLAVAYPELRRRAAPFAAAAR